MSAPAPDKAALRETAKTARQRFVTERTQAAHHASHVAARQLATHLTNAVPALHGAHVALFWSIQDEISTRPLLAQLTALGCTLAFPITPATPGPLSFHHWAPGDKLVRTAGGLFEPEPDAPAVTPDIVITPLLAFDRRGHRLGYGKGYYDRTFAAISADKQPHRVGLAFAIQEVDTVPAEAHDRPLDAIVTEREVITPNKVITPKAE